MTKILIVAATAMLAACASANADTILATFTGSGSDFTNPLTSTVSGSVQFILSSSGKLVVKLSSTTAADQFISRDDLLDGVEFNLASGITLGTGSASAPGSPAFVQVGASTSTGVTSDTGTANSGWGAAITGSAVGIGAAQYTGLSANPTNAFDGTALGGADYGLLTAGIGNVDKADGFNKSNPYTNGEIDITFNVTGGTLTSTSFSSVQFLFGEDGTSHLAIATINGTAVPTPAALGGGTALLAGLLAAGIRKNRR